MPRTFNDIGTAYYGATNRNADGSFVTTEWFTFILPILPLKSFRAHYLTEKQSFSENTKFYQIIERVPLDKRHVLSVYGSYILVPISFVLWAVVSAAAGGFLTTIGTVVGILSGIILLIGLFYLHKKVFAAK